MESQVVECSMGSPVDWKEIYMKQSVVKCKQINFLCICKSALQDLRLE